MMRRVGCVVAVAAIWFLVLAWAAQVRWSSPLLPQERVGFVAHDFRVVVGAGAEDGSALHVGAVGDDGSALQTVHASLDAEQHTVLRYRFDGFPRTLELSFVFRREDTPEDVQAVTVPWPGDGWRSVDLSKVPEWHGRVLELGFAEYPTPQIAPESVAFRPFRFDRAELWSPSWRGSFAALYTSWFGYTPWALLSVSALGPQREVAQPPPLLPFAVLGAALTLCVLAWTLRWPRATLFGRAAIAALAVWVALDLIWLDDLHGKHALTESVYRGKPWAEREQLVPDQDLVAAAAQVRGYFASHGAQQRILVSADSKYVFLRLIYLLLPLNAAPLQQANAAQWRLPDTFVLLYRDSQWHYDADRGTLLDANGAPDAATERIFRGAFDAADTGRLEPVLESGDMHLYAFRGAAR